MICDEVAIRKYHFDWGNSDCRGILPSVIIRPRSDEDVSRVVQRSVSHGISLSYRSGGHSYTCDGIKAGSAHIDLRSMKSKRLYHQGSDWYAEFETGNTFRDLFRIIDRRRFSIVHGACHAVGVGGFYLHGGIHLNSLTAIYGWGNTTVVSMTVVTSSGKILDLSPASRHQDLWRGMLRAGSNFGIATKLTVRVFERPEPRTWLFFVQTSHAEVVQLFRRGMLDPRVQLNIFYVNPPVFQVGSNRSEIFTLQFTLLHGPDDYWRNLRQSVRWFDSQGFHLPRWTILFNAVVPKPDDLTKLGYHRAWQSSHAIWTASSKCTLEAMHMLLREQAAIIQRSKFHSLVGFDCWLTFAELPSNQIYYEYLCPSSDFFAEHLRKVEARFSTMCEDFVKYRNVPFREAASHRYFPDHRDLLRTKKKWDPQFLFGPDTMSLKDLGSRMS